MTRKFFARFQRPDGEMVYLYPGVEVVRGARVERLEVVTDDLRLADLEAVLPAVNMVETTTRRFFRLVRLAKLAGDLPELLDDAGEILHEHLLVGGENPSHPHFGAVCDRVRHAASELRDARRREAEPKLQGRPLRLSAVMAAMVGAGPTRQMIEATGGRIVETRPAPSSQADGLNRRKFNVSRSDERDGPGGDREGAEYIVLDLTYDEHARPAAAVYASLITNDYPLTALDIIDLLQRIAPAPEGHQVEIPPKIAAFEKTPWGPRELAEPIPMLLFCPVCGIKHVDAPDPANGWENPPHRSHLCNYCGHVWRPSDVATTGVEALETHGEHDGDPSPAWGRAAPAYDGNVMADQVPIFSLPEATLKLLEEASYSILTAADALDGPATSDDIDGECWGARTLADDINEHVAKARGTAYERPDRGPDPTSPEGRVERDRRRYERRLEEREGAAEGGMLDDDGGE